VTPAAKDAVKRAREVLARDVDPADPVAWARRTGALEFCLEELLRIVEASR
jgi:hypothetical protein